jgi:CubicO group peptidase (beta-lactamase class C family)/sugar lactone lactonase YvrE
VTATGVTPAPTPETSAEGFLLEGVGFETPESVLYDPEADVYLVANIHGGPSDKDGNGFVSRISPEGEVVALKWIDGAAESAMLNAPKGMALVGDRLFVADIDVVRVFDRESGGSVDQIPIAGASFLNDVASDEEGVVYVTDSGTGVIHRIMPGGSLQRAGEVQNPNGIQASGETILVTGGNNQIFQLDDDGALTPTYEAPAGGLDGLVVLDNGSVLVSSWVGSAVYRFDADGQVTELFSGINAPADIGFDTKRQLVLIPHFKDDRVEARPLPSTQTSLPTETSSPSEVGGPPDPRIAEIEALMAAYEQADIFSGAVLVAEGGQIVYERVVGYANREWLIPNTIDTRFRIASLSKQFTKVLVLQLVEEGKLSLDGTIADYLPDYSGPGADQITIQLLLDHRSGIAAESAVQDLERIERDYYTQDQMLELIAGYDLWFEPGARWGYSNFGYYFLGTIIESASGRTYGELLQERICAPAGMQDTFPEVTSDIIARRASGYRLDAKGAWAHDSPLDMSFVFGYGQLISTVRDLYHFDIALRGGELLNQAHTRSLVGTEAEQRPLGNGGCRAYVFEDGPASINGFRASTHSYIREDRFVVVLENVRGDGAIPVFELGRNIAAILYGCSYDPPETGDSR